MFSVPAGYVNIDTIVASEDIILPPLPIKFLGLIKQFVKGVTRKKLLISQSILVACLRGICGTTNKIFNER